MKSFAILLACAVPAFGRIGETRQECHKRYSVNPSLPVPTESQAKYTKSGMKITVGFRGDRCIGIAYAKIDGSPIDQVEIEKLLAGNAASDWVAEPEKGGLRGWKSADGKVDCSYLIEQKVLFITTIEELKTREREKAAALDGL